jgi:hypothetical protein
MVYRYEISENNVAICRVGYVLEYGCNHFMIFLHRGACTLQKIQGAGKERLNFKANG